MTRRALVVVPAYGDRALTEAVVRDATRERALVDVLVVDNQGDYRPRGDEAVLRPGMNLGWLRACNVGIRDAVARGVDVVLLNNDTRLSRGFFAGLQQGAEAVPGAVIAPRYDDRAFACQFAAVDGGVGAYVPHAQEVVVPVVDGTCALIPRAVVLAVGELDDRRFGRHGWGAMDDYCLRVRTAGGLVAVTSRAFLTHARASTARVVTTRYEHFAAAEMEVGMVRKHGLRWRDSFGDTFADPGAGDRALAFARHAQERLGLGAVEWRHLVRRQSRSGPVAGDDTARP